MTHDPATWWETIPKHVKVGYRVIEIVQWDVWDAARAQHWAEFDPGKEEIRLIPWCSAQKAANSMIHEICHVIVAVWGIDDGHMTEEEFCIVAANGWSTVIRDNPVMMRWLIHALEV